MRLSLLSSLLCASLALAPAAASAQSASDPSGKPLPPPAAATSPQPQGPLAPGGAAGIAKAQANGPNIDKLAVVTVGILGAVGLYFIVGTKYHVPQKSGSASSTK